MIIQRRSALLRSYIIIKLFVKIFWSFYSLRFYRLFHGSLWAEQKKRQLYASQARRFRETAIELGGLLIKLGQFFSTRVDILPAESIEELSGLQDEVAAEEFGKVKLLIESEFSCLIHEVFPFIEEKALASASLGQVHRGKLASGQIVAIKIQRPDIENIIAIDFKAIRKVINMIKIFTDWEKFVDLDAIYHEFYETILAELDYIKEGKNAETIAANCADDPAIIIPAIIWEYTRTRVLTMEYMEGIKISDHQALEAAGINRAALAEKLLQTYIKQVLIHGFYHADPHPGNLFVDQEGHLIMLDFGMVGSIPVALRDLLLEMVYALVNRDFDKVLEYLRKAGFIRYNAESEALTRALAIFIEQFLGQEQELSSLDLNYLLQDLETLLYEQPFQIPANFTFLGRALGTLYGICIGLNPEINFIDVARPYVEEIAPKGSGIFRLLKDKTTQLATSLLELPPLALNVLRKAERGDLSVRVSFQSVNEAIAENTRATRALTWALVFGCLLFGTIYLMVNHFEQVARYTGIFAVISLLPVIINSRNRGRRHAPHPPVMIKRNK